MVFDAILWLADEAVVAQVRGVAKILCERFREFICGKGLMDVGLWRDYSSDDGNPLAAGELFGTVGDGVNIGNV